MEMTKKQRIRKAIKNISKYVAAFGTETVIAMIVKAFCPKDVKLIMKLLIFVGTISLETVAGNAVMKATEAYFDELYESLDELKKAVEELKNPEEMETVVEI